MGMVGRVLPTAAKLVLALGSAGVAPVAGSRVDARAQQVPAVGHGEVLSEVIVEVGDARIRALCTSGRPEALILHGDESSAEDWRPVLERLQGRVGSCAYDRRGSGASSDAPERRGWYELLDELRRIHVALGARAPYVLVGHSLGGLYARLYALDRPRDVAGLVLVDPSHEDMPTRVRPGMHREAWREWMQLRSRPNADGVVERRVGARARGGRLQGIAVTVLTGSVRRDTEGWNPRFLNEAARQVHASIVDGLTQGRHVPAAGSGPDIHRDDPDLVAAEILRVVGALRRAESVGRRPPG